MALLIPVFPYDTGGMSIVTEPDSKKIPTSLSSAAIAPGTLLKAGTGGFQAAVDGDDLILYIVAELVDEQGRKQTRQYATAADLAATDHYCTVYKLDSNFKMLVGEDGVGGNVNFPTNSFADFAVLTPSVISPNAIPDGGSYAKWQIDSSTAAATGTGKALQLIAQDNSTDAALVPSASPKNYIVIKNPSP